MPKLKSICLIDEATRVFAKELSQGVGSGYIPPQKRAITGIRKTGMGILAGVQILSDTDEALKSNIATLLCLRCPNPKEAREASQLLALPLEALPDLQSLPIGVGYVRSEGFDRPIKIWIPNLDLGPAPSDEQMAAKLASSMAKLQKETIYSPTRPERARPLSYSDILDGSDESSTSVTDPDHEEIQPRLFDDHRDMLREITSHPDASISEHYRKLKWGASRGSRVKEQLVDMGLIRTAIQKSTNGRPREILGLTKKGEELLNDISA